MTRTALSLAAGLLLAACEPGPAFSPTIAPLGAAYLASADSGVTSLRDLRPGDRLEVEAQAMGCFSSSLIRATVALDSTGEWSVTGEAGFGGPLGLYPLPRRWLSETEREGLDGFFDALRPYDSTQWCTNHEILTLAIIRDGTPVRREIIDNSSCPATDQPRLVSLYSLFQPAFQRAEAALQ